MAVPNGVHSVSEEAMSARILLEVALRVLGMWVCLSGVTGLTSVVSFCLQTGSATPDVMLSAVPIVMQLLLGGVMLFGAPGIAARFYRRDGANHVLQIAVGRGDVFRIACFLLGVCLLVHASIPAVRLAMFGFLGTGFGARELSEVLEMTVNLAIGIWLVIGSRAIAAFLSNLRYDPDTIPAQRFSIAMLLVLFAMIAVFLGLIRIASLGHP